MNTISTEQQAAIHFVDEYAKKLSLKSRETLAVICSRSNVERHVIDHIIHNIQTHGQIAVHFHPDVLNPQGISVSENLLHSGLYQNQFATNISNGLLEPTKNGRRAKWEDMLFGSTYQGADLSFRPKYGSLHLMGNSYGSSPRFGSCYLLLKPACMRYATFCYGDSSENPEERGTWKYFESILTALFVDAFRNEHVLGYSNIRPSSLFLHFLQNIPSQKAIQDGIALRNLNHYIEAQIHCDISLSRDATTLVADPSFQNTKYGDMFQKICSRYNLQLKWHDGFQLHVDDVVDDFRGGQMSNVARKIAKKDIIHAACIGNARIDAIKQPQNWNHFEEPPARLLKYLWHVLLRFGKQYNEPNIHR